MNGNDADGHYVNCNVYFFKNSFLSDGQDPGSLLNVSFDKNFNPAYTEESDSFSDGDNNLMKGFEEILKYIEKENKYRKIKENSTNKDNTENQEKKKVTLLSTKISQARAIEYIINYRLKRNDLPTGKIRVLELQPARSQGEITSSQVLGWLGHEMTVISCCNHTGEPAANVLNDEESIWHSAYTSRIIKVSIIWKYPLRIQKTLMGLFTELDQLARMVQYINIYWNYMMRTIIR